MDDADINCRLVGYCSDQAHSSIEKAALIGLVKMRYIQSDANYSMRGPALQQAIKRDREKGLIPFWVSSVYYNSTKFISAKLFLNSCNFEIRPEILIYFQLILKFNYSPFKLIL